MKPNRTAKIILTILAFPAAFGIGTLAQLYLPYQDKGTEIFTFGMGALIIMIYLVWKDDWNGKAWDTTELSVEKARKYKKILLFYILGMFLATFLGYGLFHLLYG